MLKDLFKRLAEKELNIDVTDEVKDLWSKVAFYNFKYLEYACSIFFDSIALRFL